MVRKWEFNILTALGETNFRNDFLLRSRSLTFLLAPLRANETMVETRLSFTFQGVFDRQDSSLAILSTSTRFLTFLPIVALLTGTGDSLPVSWPIRRVGPFVVCITRRAESLILSSIGITAFSQIQPYQRFSAGARRVHG